MWASWSDAYSIVAASFECKDIESLKIEQLFLVAVQIRRRGGICAAVRLIRVGRLVGEAETRPEDRPYARAASTHALLSVLLLLSVRWGWGWGGRGGGWGRWGGLVHVRLECVLDGDWADPFAWDHSLDEWHECRYVRQSVHPAWNVFPAYRLEINLKKNF